MERPDKDEKCSDVSPMQCLGRFFTVKSCRLDVLPSCQLESLPACCLDCWLAVHRPIVLARQQESTPASKADSELSCQRERVLASKPAIVLSVEA
ncbi:hypothetical protein KBY67_13730 [Synechococcus sp. RedBA-s]|nr:hypothetical protein [Synechococcus sp. RedBA-s]